MNDSIKITQLWGTDERPEFTHILLTIEMTHISSVVAEKIGTMNALQRSNKKWGDFSKDKELFQELLLDTLEGFG